MKKIYDHTAVKGAVFLLLAVFTAYFVNFMFAADPICGNSVVEDAEQCDDGNADAGDGCNASCQFEPMTDGVSAVVGADTDTTNFGLSGSDFSVTWTPSTTAPVGEFLGTKIYVLPNATTVTSTTIESTACGGGMCMEVGFFSQYTQSSHTVPPFMVNDSEGNAWNAGTTYKTCVLTKSVIPKLDCSSAFDVISDDDVDDTMAPFIDHFPLHTAITGGVAVLHAFLDDDQAITADFTDGGNSAISKIYYGDGFTTEVDAVAVGAVDGLFTFTTSAGVTEGFSYYLMAQDKADTPNVGVFAQSPEATLANASSSPIAPQLTSAGSRTITGTISDFSDTAIQGAYVFLGGYGKAGVLTDGSGNYTINNVPDGGYDIVASKTGYCRMSRFEPVSSNLTGINLQLNEGECQFFGPVGGDGMSGSPFVIFTGPPEGSSNVSPDESIRVGISQPLSAQTVNDASSTADTDNIYLIGPDGNAVAGAVVYCPENTSAGCTSLSSMDTNTILFTPTASLSEGPHTLVIKGNVTSESGQAIEGSRPGGGHNLNFSVGGGVMDTTTININYGDSGAYMPPFVASMMPSPFQGVVPPNTKILLEFNEQMQSATINTNNIKLIKTLTGEYKSITVVLDSNSQNKATITPTSNLADGEYEIRVYANAANVNGIPMMDPNRPYASQDDFAFTSTFEVAGSSDTTAPTVYPFLPDGSTGVDVSVGEIEFGFSEPMDVSTLTNTNITLKRGTNNVSKNITYESGMNSLFIVPDSILAPNTTYTLTFTTDVKDMSNVALASSTVFTFTTGGVDSADPEMVEARCDDYSCFVRFSEQMNSDTSIDSGFADSVLNHANISLTAGGSDLVVSGANITYDNVDRGIRIEGLDIGVGTDFVLTVESTAKDLSGNGINTANGVNVFNGKVEDSSMTYGSFGGSTMFAPPVYVEGGMMGGMGGTIGTMEYKPEGFGTFTAEQFAFGEAVEAFPFSNMASGDVNVFQVRIPMDQIGYPVQDGDQFVFTFPNGTTITNTSQDTFSPYYTDFNQWEPGTITFDSTFDSDGIAINDSTGAVTVQMDVTGAPTATDFITIDLRGITNPPIPRGPESGGYTLDVKFKRSGTVLTNVSSIPYFISGAGTNTITVKVYAGTEGSGTAGANGNVFMFGGGPSGPMDKQLTLTNGVTTAEDGTTIAGDAGVVYSNLPDGCYHLGTDPFVTLGGSDYFGQSFPEPICVFGGESKSKSITLSAASGGGSISVTVKINHTGGTFDGADIEIFAGGPGRFVVKTIENVGVPDPAGYTINLPQNGFWNVGVGPAMPKGPSAGPPDFEAFGAMPPPPVDLEVRGLPGSGTVRRGMHSPQGVVFDDSTDTVTFTVRTSSIEIPVQVTDGTTGLANVEVFMHQLGFGGGAFGKTDNDGNVTLKVADYGPYEIGAFIPGLGDTHKQIDIKNDSGTKIYYNGAQVATVPLKLLKSDYTISGKVLNADGDPVSYAPVWAENTDGRFVPGGTGADGSFTLFVSTGTWTLYSEPPPSETSICGIFQKTVTIINASKSAQNISPTNSTCYTLSGTLTIDGNTQSNKFMFVESWDTVNDRPAGGFHRGISTDSIGAYSAEVPAGTYRIGTFDPNFGELGETVVVSADVTQNVNSGALSAVTFSFTGGTSAMNGFIEIKRSGDQHTRFGKPFNGSDENIVLNVKSGTYNYMIDIFGVGSFTGTVIAGNTATIDLSENTMVTLSGTIYDTDEAVVPNAIVAIHDFDNGVDRFVQTDSSGDYSMEVKTGTYEIEVNRAGYAAPSPTVTLTEDTTGYDFGGADPDQNALLEATKTISGTVYKSGGSQLVEDGFVWAENSGGNVVSSPIDPTDGTYTLNVTEDSSWTVSATAPMHDETDLSATVNTTDVTDDIGKDIILTANANKIPKSVNSTVNMATGGTVDDRNNTGMRMIASGGALDTSQGIATVSMEKSFTAPKTAKYSPLEQISYDLSVTDSSDQAIKDFSGNVELTFDYDPTTLPTGIDEDDLSVMYFSNEANTYRECEGGVTVDETNNAITCVVNHATKFSITYPTSQVSATVAPVTTSPTTTSSTSGGGGGGGASSIVIAFDSNTATSVISTSLTASINKARDITRSIEVHDDLIVETEGLKTVKLTESEGVITLKPNKDSTVSAEIPADTTVTGSADWDGKISPPLIKSATMISKNGEAIEGTTRKISRESVKAIVKVGSEKSILNFNNPVVLEIPVEDVQDGQKLQIYYSEDGNNWKLFNEGQLYEAVNGKVFIGTMHFTYFAVVDPDGGAEMHASAPAVSFTDIIGHWAEDYITQIYDLGIVSGKTSGNFAPNDFITRAELTKIAVNALGFNLPSTISDTYFTDVAKNAWYTPYIVAAKKKNVINGYSDSTFRPNSLINRAEALKILIAAAGFDIDSSATVNFSDTYTGAWYMKYLAFAVNSTIVDGYDDGTFLPANNITRAEVSKITAKILDMLK